MLKTTAMIIKDINEYATPGYLLAGSIYGPSYLYDEPSLFYGKIQAECSLNEIKKC